MKKIERKELSSGPHVLSPLRRGRAVGGRSLGGRCPHYAIPTRKGREKGVPTPVNEAVRQLMKRIERKEICSGLHALEPLLSLVNG